MTPPLAFSYVDGMFSNEPLREHPFAAAAELEATCYHEASHAVLDYLFGRPLVSVGISATYEHDADGELTVGYGGEVRVCGPDRVRIDYNYRRLHFTIGVASAAGPAGECRFRHQAGLPMRLLHASVSDHLNIDAVAKALERRGRCRYAFRRHVWRYAQKYVAAAPIWNTISDVALELFNEGVAELDMDTEYPGERWAYLDPKLVYALCRRNGLKRGMLNAA